MPSLRVLLAEDNETEAVQTRSMLSEAGEESMQVDWVSSGEEVLARMRENGYDAYLVDVKLGGESGLDVLKQARAAGIDAPIVLLADYGGGGGEHEAFRQGAADYLVKGETTAPLLQRAIRHAVERAAAARALRETEARLLRADRMESLGRLAGGIAHDFNNLLSGILTCTTLLERQIDPDHPAREPVDSIRRSAEVAARLVRQLLAYGRKARLEPEDVDLNRVVEGLTEILRRVSGDHLTFDVRLSPDLPLVRSDRAQLEQVVLNLALNARDATPPGGRITVRTELVTLDENEAATEGVERAGEYVAVVVEDTGHGIPADVLPRIFEPFFTTKPAGTGLGLATAYGIVRQSGGFIRVESRPGAGTTIGAYLPAVPGSRPRRRAEDTDALLPGNGESVLVVEDDAAVRRYVEAVLVRLGYRVRLVESPEEALQLLEADDEPLHLLLTDVVLPEMSGMHLAQRVAKLRPNVRVIFMSGYIDPRTGHAALPVDATFLRKPFPPDELARIVRQALGPA
ncbi:MAG TPA: response regulator [Vicinamibacterales bacterium]